MLAKKERLGNYRTISEHFNWAEQDPNVWWQDTVFSIGKVMSQISWTDSEIAAICVSSQGMAMLPLDEQRNPLCRAHIWMDRRAAEETAWLEKVYGRERIKREFGAYADPYYQIMNLIWYRNHCPRLYERTRYIVKANTYLNYKLTGQIAIDEGQAEMTLCYDLKKRCWSEELEKVIEIPLGDWMPPVKRADEILGTVTKKRLNDWSAGRNSCVGRRRRFCGRAAGIRDLSPGRGAEIYRTSSNNFLPAKNHRLEKSKLLSFSPIVSTEEVPCLLFGPTNSSGDTVRWFRESMGEETERQKMQAAGRKNIYEMYEEMVRSSRPGSGGVFFYPYLMGERAPLWDSAVKGMYMGLTALTARADMLRAVYEGNAYALKEICGEAEKEGAKLSCMKIAGGCANSREWLRIKASVLDMPVHVSASLSGAPKGDAMLAGYAAGIYRSMEEAYEIMKSPEQVIEPVSEWSKIYGELYPLFLTMRDHLLEDYQELERKMRKLF